MRALEYTNQFKRDYKRELSGSNKAILTSAFPKIVETLATDITLEKHFKDHPLIGDWKDHRDCHLKPDLLLIYRKVGDDILQLVRIGSHSELGL